MALDLDETMFWRGEGEMENEKLIGETPCRQVRVLVVGDSDVGKTSLVHLIIKGSSVPRPPQTIGCKVDVKYTTYGTSGTSSRSSKGGTERDFFIELWDISGRERFVRLRETHSILRYSPYKPTICHYGGVIFVHDLSHRRTKTSLQKWATEIATNGTFSAPQGSGGPGGLPVPFIVVGNKADIAPKEDTRGRSGNLVDVARQWVEKQGLLPSSEELPLTETFPSSGGLIAAARDSRYDKEAVMKFFRMLIRRRYFSDELRSANPLSTPIERPLQQRSRENLHDEDQIYKSTSLTGDPYKYNALPPLPAQHNLTPPQSLLPLYQLQKTTTSPDLH